MREPRITRVDLRVTKYINLTPRLRVQGNVDIYNALNGASILSMNAGYGTNWLVPYEIMGGRLFKFSGQIEF